MGHIVKVLIVLICEYYGLPCHLFARNNSFSESDILFSLFCTWWRNDILIYIAVVQHRLAAERDTAERDSREKETKILSQSRELEELRNRLADADRISQQQQAELSELMSSKDDVGKNVRAYVTYF